MPAESLNDRQYEVERRIRRYRARLCNLLCGLCGKPENHKARHTAAKAKSINTSEP
jgi:hypothetical protein